jgi:ABC-type transporter lipoprotein component MlaA
LVTCNLRHGHRYRTLARSLETGCSTSRAPRTVRDGLGTLVDFAFRPTTYLFGSAALADVVPLFASGAGVWDHLIYQTMQGAGTGFVERESKAAELAVLRHSSIDLYAALRSAYTQDREAAIWHRREHHHASGSSRVP